MTRRMLPIGMQTFSEIRERSCYYVDKTAYVARLLDEGKHYFLSRPRRFGKSLFLDTCKELFEGNEPLFEGLAICDRWDWSVRHPRAAPQLRQRQLQGAGPVGVELQGAARRGGAAGGGSDRLRYGARAFRIPAGSAASAVGQPVAVLVDEYDKPILDALEEPEVARANRDFLRSVYAVVKDSDAHIRFSFITGVSRSLQPGSARGCPSHETASKVSLFSGLNNLKDITLSPHYSAICGYTEADLDTVFAPELGGLDRAQVRDWYNGYSWRGDEKVYNPFDILLLFDTREFAAHWFETGTPTFLVDTLFRRRVSSLALDGMVGSAELLSTFDVDDMPTEALLFQTGYLTIERPEPRGGEMFYRLGYPNREVRQSLNRSLLNRMTGDASRRAAHSARLYDLLLVNDFAGLAVLFESFFASIPYEWYTNNDIAGYEGFYASVFYSYFAGLGLNVTVEDSSSHGRLDMALRFNGQVYLFEFKVVEMAPEGAAMAQLKAKGYAEKYRGRGEPIHLIAVEFSRKARNLAAFDVERV